MTHFEESRDPAEAAASERKVAARLGYGILVGLGTLAVLPLFSWAVSHLTTRPTASKFTVDMRGREFDWYFDVAPTERTGAAANELHLPAGVPVEMRVTSEDYVYSLRIPEWGVHTIVVPGIVSVIRITPTEPLDRILLVDPMCGFSALHDDVMGRIVVNGKGCS